MVESAFKSLSYSAKSPSLMACKPYYGTDHHPTKAPSLPRLRAPPQPPLLPPPQYPSWPASREVPRDKKPRNATPSPKNPAPALANDASADSSPIVVAAATEQELEWATDSLYSVSPSPSSLPMPTSLLITAGRKVPTACAAEVAAAASGDGCVDVGATDELRRLLRL